MSSNVDRLRNILYDHQTKMTTPTIPSSHRLPRLNPYKNDGENKLSGLPRTFMSSYNSGWDPLSEAEQSILVSKVPASRPQTPSMFTKRGHERIDPRSVPGVSNLTVQPGLGSGSSTSTIDIIEEQTKTTTKTTTRTSAIGGPTSPANGHSIVSSDHLVTTILATKNDDDLEEVLRKLKPTQLFSACTQLVDHIRRIERQAELREELLRRSQKQIESRDQAIKERDLAIRKLEKDLLRIDEVEEQIQIDKNSSPPSSSPDDSSTLAWSTSSATLRCRFSSSGCPYRLPSMEDHEERECHYRPTRCPSLTCSAKPAFSSLLGHIDDEHDGTKKGRDRICRNTTNHLISSYVNIDKEPIFYKTSRMTWVANELVLDNKHHFFLECMRIPPDWHIWLYYLGGESEANKFQVTITLFREEEYGKMEQKKIFSAQRSYTGKVISIHRSKEEIAENGLGFMVHDKQVRPLCGSIADGEEQLFGYEVTVYKK